MAGLHVAGLWFDIASICLSKLMLERQLVASSDQGFAPAVGARVTLLISISLPQFPARTQQLIEEKSFQYSHSGCEDATE
jgi:hypothetical protein